MEKNEKAVEKLKQGMDTLIKEFYNEVMPKKKTVADIQTMEDIFEIGGKTLDQIILPGDSKDEAAYKVLKFGIGVINEGVKVDHSNSKQDKYEPRFIHKAGVGLSFDDCDHWLTCTRCGPALCYLDYNCMLKGVKVMEKWYHDYMSQ